MSPSVRKALGLIYHIYAEPDQISGQCCCRAREIELLDSCCPDPYTLHTGRAEPGFPAALDAHGGRLMAVRCSGAGRPRATLSGDNGGSGLPAAGPLLPFCRPGLLSIPHHRLRQTVTLVCPPSLSKPESPVWQEKAHLPLPLHAAKRLNLYTCSLVKGSEEHSICDRVHMGNYSNAYDQGVPLLVQAGGCDKEERVTAAGRVPRAGQPCAVGGQLGPALRFLQDCAAPACQALCRLRSLRRAL